MSFKTHQDVLNNLRRGPWHESPHAVPQERSFSDGQAESVGWLSDDSVTSDVIRTDAVIARHITAGSIETEKIAAGAVTANEIAANTITANEIAANTITAAEIAADSINASELAANSVSAENIVANTITANEIAASAITADELAANSVITTKILAANVTSSRMEVSISGKDFGANSGTEAAPGYWFDSSSSTGMRLTPGGDIDFPRGGASQFRIGSTVNLSLNDLQPISNGLLDLGASSFRWDTLYCVTLDESSDARLKADVVDSPLGLDFLRRLRPVGYRRIEARDTQARQDAAQAFDPDAMERETRPHRGRIERARKRLGMLPSDHPNVALLEEDIQEARSEIASIQGRHEGPLREAAEKHRAGRRMHTGLIAQEVKAALDEAGVDAAFWKEAPDGMQSLSYTEILAPAIKAIQELADDNESLSARVAALEGNT